ncbi:NADH-cytochrome b5 reductase [Cyanidiococcus yangmingshanensis]|uniref:NADH-cytochrome b5 reductase n=1 Tax=Cyanidiococcus yangmingshanensis TaxID=2690220 RepID=A0A7J7IJH9_9RHOD|nr:NADH-cytochrome b5 reductase [Cyanidiococcus yangmingshanensis]
MDANSNWILESGTTWLSLALVGVTLLASTWLWRRYANGVEAVAPALKTDSFTTFRLVSKTAVSYNTRIFRFALTSPNQQLGLPPGRHIVIRARVPDAEEPILRPYTPISKPDTCGYFELLVKIYPAPNGRMGRYLDSLVPGRDAAEVRGPSGSFTYRPNMVAELGMIAGGTGITPMWQLIQVILGDASDRTRIKLIFANVKAEDILLRSEIDAIAAQYPDRFARFYVLNEPPADWKMGTGFVTTEHIRDFIGLPAENKLVLLCGPPPMNKAMREHLEGLGYDKSAIFRF